MLGHVVKLEQYKEAGRGKVEYGFVDSSTTLQDNIHFQWSQPVSWWCILAGLPCTVYMYVHKEDMNSLMPILVIRCFFGAMPILGILFLTTVSML